MAESALILLVAPALLKILTDGLAKLIFLRRHWRCIHATAHMIALLLGSLYHLGHLLVHVRVTVQD